MESRTSRQIWRRRTVVMAVVGLLVAIPVVLVVGGGSQESASSEGNVSGASRGATPLTPGSELRPRRVDRRVGVSYRFPRAWGSTVEAGALRLFGPRRHVAVAVSSPAAAGRSERVLDTALAALRRNYEGVEVDRGSGRRLGGLEADGAVVRARGEHGPLRILVAVVEGEQRTYLSQVFSAEGAPTRDIADAQRILNSLRFRH
jgi:hypothetical protein